MNRHTDPYRVGDPRLMVRWARSYARSRTVSFLVQWVFIVMMVLFIGVAAGLTQTAHSQGNMMLFGFSVACMCLAILALIWFSVSRWSGDLIFNITNWLYGQEGYVSYSGGPGHTGLPLWLTVMGGGLVVYHLVGALLISFNYMNIKYMQPYSAIYMTPYLIVMILYQGLGFWAWIWPLLYGIHALVLLWGFPFRFAEQYELLNIIVPVFGYGLVAILFGHIYSRYALRQLKRLTRDPLPGIDETVSDISEAAETKGPVDG